MTALEVMIVVRRGQDLLVVHRSPAEGAFWHTVSGTVEPGEDPRDTAIRELAEETGLSEAGALEELAGFVYVREAWENEPGKRVPVRVFLVEAPVGWEPVLNEEHDEYRWLSATAAADLVYWPEPSDILRSFA